LAPIKHHKPGILNKTKRPVFASISDPPNRFDIASFEYHQYFGGRRLVRRFRQRLLSRQDRAAELLRNACLLYQNQSEIKEPSGLWQRILMLIHHQTRVSSDNYKERMNE
jgi:hypothetical protein